ncbi:MAG: cobalamin-dependent protein [Candidatus Competibacteraceae bacterium]|nr:cobalamin-dependent protein [Candidatus Competibacteraceae bacterium]
MLALQGGEDAKPANATDVLFIHPGSHRSLYQGLSDAFSAIEPPAFAGLFANYLRLQGCSVGILDAAALNLEPDEAARQALEDWNPTLIALAVYGHQPSASTQLMTAAGAIAAAIKALDPARPVFMTGTHPAALPRRTLEEEAVDFVCDGEGPVTLFKTLAALQAGGRDFAHIPSLWRRQEGHIVAPTTHEPLIQDLDRTLPSIAWDLLPMDRYRAHNWHCLDRLDQRAPYASIHTSLGCPYRCSFCCINAPFHQPTYRMWSAASVLREIDRLVNDHGVYNIKIIDEMFVLNRRHVLAICDGLIARGYPLNLWAYARVDTVKPAWLAQLKAAGFNWLCLGIESASRHVRDGADKHYHNHDIVSVVRQIQAAGIHVLGNYIFGLPDDDAESLQATLDLALELNCEFANFYTAAAYPGSALYRQAVAQGLELPRRWHHFSQHSEEALPLPTATLTPAEVLAFRDRAFTTYFTAPHYLTMVERTFGAAAVEHLCCMTAIPLRRKRLETLP